MLSEHLDKISDEFSIHGNRWVVYSDQEQVSYLEFSRLVQQSISLLETNSPPSSLVALELHRSARFYALIFASLKLGRPFVTINPSWPQGRKQSVLQQSCPSLHVTDTHQYQRENWRPTHQDLAYVLFTSGSSGRPKGVCISKDNFAFFLDHLPHLLPVEPHSKISQFFDVSFDPFLADLFLGLASGSTLFPLNQSNSQNLFEFIDTHQIQYVAGTPTLYAINLRKHNVAQLPSIKRTIFTGEILQGALVKKWQKLAPQSEILNLYGPTECTIWTHSFQVNPKNFDHGPLPIGKPTNGLSAKIDKDGVMVISGPQIGMGYLNLPEETKFHFIQHENERSYFTGDLVRQLESEDFVVHGRIDDQVKIGGQRFELMELEALLLEIYPQCSFFPIVLDDHQIILVTPDKGPKIEELRNQLKDHLSTIFLPRALYFSPQIPIGANGKVDRQILETLVRSGSLKKA
jgi:non-ribosomal peptide synthetase component F